MSVDGAGGDIKLKVGKGTKGSGGDLTLLSGETSDRDESGGAVIIKGGFGSFSDFYGLSSTGGAVSISTGSGGNSGSMTLESERAQNGDSGSLTIKSGAATNGAGGDISLNVGYGDEGDGGAIDIFAGSTGDYSAVGGAVNIGGGDGQGSASSSGGDVSITGGDGMGASCTGSYMCDGIAVSSEVWLIVKAGCQCQTTFYGQEICNCLNYPVSSTIVAAVKKGCSLPCSGGGLNLNGGKSDSDQGGHVLISGGDSPGSDGAPVYLRGGAATGAGKEGGSIGLVSGMSSFDRSGSANILTYGGQFTKKSGDLLMATGGSQIESGGIILSVGSSGSASDIILSVGNSTQTDGGHVVIRGGAATAPSKKGGNVDIASGTGNGGGDLKIRAGGSTDAFRPGGDVEISGGYNQKSGRHGNIIAGPTSPRIVMGPSNNSGTIQTHGLLKTHVVSIGGGNDIAHISAHKSFISATVSPGSILPSQIYSITLSVPGTKVGDVVSASYSRSLDGLMMSAAINSDNECTITLFNPGSGDASVTLNPGKIRATVWQYND